MIQTANRWKLGLFVLVGVGIALASVVWLGASRFRRESFPVVTYFDESVEGLDEGAPVKLRGVTLGTVDRISIARNRRLVKVTMEVYPKRLEELQLNWDELVTHTEQVTNQAGDTEMHSFHAQLVPAGITGVRFIQIDLLPPGQSLDLRGELDEGERYLPSAASTIAGVLETVGLVHDKLPVVGEQVELLVRRISKLVEQVTALIETGDIQRAIASLANVVEELDREMERLDVGGLAGDLRGLLDEARAVITETRETIARLTGPDGAIDRVVGRVDEVGADASTLLRSANASLQDAALGETAGALRETAKTTNELGREGVALMAELQLLATELRSTLVAVRGLAGELERDPGSLLRGRGPDVVDPAGGR